MNLKGTQSIRKKLFRTPCESNGEKIYFGYDYGTPVVLSSCGNKEYFSPISELGTFHGLEICNGELNAHDHSQTLVKSNDGTNWNNVNYNLEEIGNLHCAESEYFNVVNSQLFRSVDMVIWEEINLPTNKTFNAIYSIE